MAAVGWVGDRPEDSTGPKGEESKPIDGNDTLADPNAPTAPVTQPVTPIAPNPPPTVNSGQGPSTRT